MSRPGSSSRYIAVFATMCVGSLGLAQSQADLELLAQHAQAYSQYSQAGRVDEAAAAAERFAALIQRRFPKRDQYKGSVVLAEAYS